MRIARLFACFVASGCISHAEPPRDPPRGAQMGLAPPRFDPARACTDWKDAVHGDAASERHVSFPELDPARACFTPVRYRREIAVPDAPPDACGYRAPDAAATLAAEADRNERIARGEDVDLPIELACKLPDRVRRAAAANNARTLRAVLRDERTYPYATVDAFGYGNYAHVGTKLDDWVPGETCPRDVDLHRFGVNVDRAARAALAYAGRVAPLVVFSGGAVHSALVEAFLLDYIATCRIGVPADRVLLDPCANHTHTNVRNTGAIVRQVGGRVSYIVTGDAFQSVYLQEWSAFDLFGGSIDQRSLRDFGHLLGSWRQASVGIDSGFWFTPYRFWADSRFRDFSCEK